MYIKELTLENFKGFDKLNMFFHPQLTVLVGVNGSGKTSILEGIAIAISTMFVNMDGLTARGIDKAKAHLKSYMIGSTKDVQPQFPVKVKASAFANQNDITWTRTLNRLNGQTTTVDAKEMIDQGVALQRRLREGDTAVKLPIIAYYGTGRLWDYHKEKPNDVFKTNNRSNGYIDCVDGTANIKLMMNWFKKMTVQKYQNQELGLGSLPELDAVYKAMENCYKRITGNDDVKIQYNMGTNELEIAYTDASGELMRMPINQLSDGYKSTISLVADIAYRMAVLNPQLLEKVCLETEGIILIDEVDLHLHPTWQQRILSDLTAIFPKVQFIVTTHAPAVISTVKSENIVMLDKGEVFEPSGEVHGKDVNTIMSGIMKTAERPAAIKQLFADFYGFIDSNDVEKADVVLQKIKEQIGEDDAEIAACNIKLKLLMMRKPK